MCCILVTAFQVEKEEWYSILDGIYLSVIPVSDGNERGKTTEKQKQCASL